MTIASVQQVDYTIRVSSRAKRVILGLEVIVPRGFNFKRLPEILKANETWIANQLKKSLHSTGQSTGQTKPEHIDLSAIDQCWQVEYRPGSDGEFLLSEAGPGVLRIIEGDAADVQGIALVLTRWLHLKAHAHLVPWLRNVSQELDICFKNTTVRGQTTRWASCSSLGNISINRNLLFLPERLVRHVFLHELCHIKQLNHSPRFWALLGEIESNYKNLEAELKQANEHVPRWVLGR